MKLGAKLLLAQLITAVVAFAAGQVNGLLLEKEAEMLERQREAQRELFATLNDTADQVAQLNAGVYRTVALMASLDEAKVKAVRAELAGQLAAVQRTLAAVGGEAGGDGTLKGTTADALGQIERFGKQADQALDLASVDPNTGIAALQTAEASYKALAQTLAKLKSRLDDNATASNRASRDRSARIGLVTTAVGLLVALLVIGLVWRVLRRLVADIGAASALAREVAAGRLGHSPPSGRRDELGDLLGALGLMQQQLHRLVGEVRGAADQVASASTQIAQGNQDLSRRTAAQATALERSAAAMEQLGVSAQHSADNAQQARQLAQGASAVAERGGAVVSEVVSTMKAIEQSSRQITEILSVIDGIAFQTNILALNAAVEAARAGEQGRGFAVVAGEVRSLAQRSATAAKAISVLIGNSVERVGQGAVLVDKAGATMAEIVHSIRRVADIVGEISAASSEQSRGVAQARGAIGELDSATQQNAALVEVSATSAASLEAQAQQLVRTMAAFDLAPAAEPALPVSAEAPATRGGLDGADALGAPIAAVAR